MVTDYAALKAENERRYGTDIGRVGPMLLANRYDDRTHFIFELLQNAEDALRRREGWEGPRSVEFEVSSTDLRVSHFGTPFEERDVRGICGIAESTKDLGSIGRFGIGFKSVYAFTDSPEIHSGDEHFAIDSFVWPRGIPPIESESGKTTFIFPFRQQDTSAASEVGSGLRKLGLRALLFLREVEAVSWRTNGETSGEYHRTTPEYLEEHARRVVVSAGEDAQRRSEETWLIFSRRVATRAGRAAGYVEIAFLLAPASDKRPHSVRRIPDSSLVVFFPTIVTTNLGFLVHGPYRTTPSRDNVSRDDAWNKYLVKETGRLLVEALRSLRDLDLLDATALRSLPLERAKFGETTLFASLFESVRSALLTERLLPAFGGGHVPATVAKLPGTRELRRLFSPAQLGALLGRERGLVWLDDGITRDRTPELFRYLVSELEVDEESTETLLRRLTRKFLEAQEDSWIVQLYEFLAGQPTLLQLVRSLQIPLIRLDDGSHVPPWVDNHPQAFLPGLTPTSFPTIRQGLCCSDAARAFLKALGLTEPDPVDDVIQNVLPRHQSGQPQPKEDDYASDISRIARAFGTDSASRRANLVKALRNCRFVAAVETRSGSRSFVAPTDVYVATDRLKRLFIDVPGVLFVDDSYQCLSGAGVQEILEACGASASLRLVSLDTRFSYEELLKMRHRAGCEDSTRTIAVTDFTLEGLDALLTVLPTFDLAVAAEKAALLWDCLSEFADRRGKFVGAYRWFYYSERRYEFEAAFVRTLNERAWIPTSDGALAPPRTVFFEETGWSPHPLVMSRIRFKPATIKALAQEAGIELGALALLKRLGITTEGDLKARLGLTAEDHRESKEASTVSPKGRPVEGATNEPTAGEELPEVPPGDWPPRGGEGPPDSDTEIGAAGAKAGGPIDQPSQPTRSQDGRETSQGAPRTFISYVSVQAQEEETDGLTHKECMALEASAIDFILECEPGLHRMPTNNPGFDLIEMGSDGPVRWIEVKAMRRDLRAHPVGMTRNEFEFAQEHGAAYWLYIVERAGSPEAHIVKIHDPAGQARTFTFDRGWLKVASERNE